MKLSHRLGLVAASALVLVGGGAGVAGAASTSGGSLNARVVALGDTEAPTPADAAECQQVPLGELPEGITLPEGIGESGSTDATDGAAGVLEGEVVAMGAATSSGSVTVDADGTVTTSGDVPQEILDAIENGTFGTEGASGDAAIDAANGLVVESIDVPVDGTEIVAVDASQAAADGLVVSCMVMATEATEVAPG